MNNLALVVVIVIIIIGIASAAVFRQQGKNTGQAGEVPSTTTTGQKPSPATTTSEPGTTATSQESGGHNKVTAWDIAGEFTTIRLMHEPED